MFAEEYEKKDRSGYLSLYLHIPFCVRKCKYCDFLSFPSLAETRDRYVDLLAREIQLAGEADAERYGKKYPVDTVYFGGGTPSILTAAQSEKLFAALRESYDILPDAEITAECNPGASDMQILCAWKALGVNRLSLGIQSLSDAELIALGRIHTAEDARETYEEARAAGFANISCDLMSALPGQSAESCLASAEALCKMGPEHISSYSLIIEPGTPFYHLYGPNADLAAAESGGYLPLPDEDTERRMYWETGELLASYGYRHYEISNYAKPGRESLHNTGYWKGHAYRGLGLGASSYLGGYRFRNTCDFLAYEKALSGNITGEQPGGTAPAGNAQQGTAAETSDAPGKSAENHAAAILNALHREVTKETENDRIEEFLFLGLRMTDGVSEDVFRRTFGREITEVYGDIPGRQEREGLIERKNGRVFLTPRGTDISNTVMADYIL